MAIVNNGITSNTIDIIGDIAALMGLNKSTVGLNEIIAAAPQLINPYAKYKSVPAGTQFPNRGSDWWKGTNGQCGFIINEYLTEEALYKGKGDDWAYLPDRQYSRQIDFINYWKDAPSLHGGCNIPDRAGQGISQTIKLQNSLTTPEHLYELTPDDIKIDGVSLNQLYFGVVTYRNGAPINRFFASQPGLFQGVNCTLSEMYIDNGTTVGQKANVGVGTTIEVLPCLARTNMIFSGRTKLYRLPEIGLSSVSIASPGSGTGGGGTTSDPFSIYLSAIWRLGRLEITTQVTGTTSTPIYNCGVKVYRGNSSTILWYDNFDLPAQSGTTSRVYKLTPSDIGGSANTAVKVEFSIRAGEYKKSVMAIMPDPDNDNEIILTT